MVETLVFLWENDRQDLVILREADFCVESAQLTLEPAIPDEPTKQPTAKEQDGEPYDHDDPPEVTVHERICDRDRGERSTKAK